MVFEEERKARRIRYRGQGNHTAARRTVGRDGTGSGIDPKRKTLVDRGRETRLCFRGERERDAFWKEIESVRKHMSPWETAFSRCTVESMSADQQINASWRIEAMGAILWALEVVDEIPPYDTQFTPEDFGEFLIADPAEFISGAVMRSNDEIDSARDLVESWHWRSRTRQLVEEGRPFPSNPQLAEAGFTSYDSVVRASARLHKENGSIIGIIDEDFSAFGKPYRDVSADEWELIRSITVERHYALNWLYGYAPGHRWDETPTDT